jgi:TPR repeat protein
MLRSLLILILPFATLLATATSGDALKGTPNRLGLLEIPISDDLAKAEAGELAKWRAMAAAGDQEAQTHLASMYYLGKGAPLDWIEAQAWLRKASAGGDRDAQTRLGIMCFLGQGGPRDPIEALKWFRKAAQQGEPHAQGCMGVAYAVGAGVPRDLAEAYYWLYQAKAGGDAGADLPFQRVKERLSPAEIQEGNRRAAQAILERGPD